jgi:NAD(P)-dependent dehydrogenase (short-subunit alcohol dehydrogenase family)
MGWTNSHPHHFRIGGKDYGDPMLMAENFEEFDYALAMARARAALVIGNRDAAKGEEVVALIRQAGGRAVFQKTDVSKHADVKALVERAVAEFGRLAVAYNNAGTDGEQVPLHEQDTEKLPVDGGVCSQ